MHDSREARARPLGIVNLAWQPYSDQRKRNQAIFENLLADDTLFAAGLFVNPPSVSGRSMSFRQRFQMLAASPPTEKPLPAATVVTPVFSLPFSWRSAVAKAQTVLVARRLRVLLNGRRYLLWVNAPYLHSFLLAQALAPTAVKTVVDLSDDFTAFQGKDAEGDCARVRALVESCDALLTVNQHVADKFHHPLTLVFENSTDFENFQRNDPTMQLADVLPKPPGQKYVGFSGGLYQGRVDEDLLLHLMRGLPAVRFVFVGATSATELARRIAEQPNARVLPAVSYSKLPTVIRSFDVAIVPHLDNEFSRGNDLLKIRDYLACGVPVVATPASNTDRFIPAISVARDTREFIDRVRGLLDGTSAFDPNPGIEIARQQSWNRTVPVLAQWLKREVLS